MLAHGHRNAFYVRGQLKKAEGELYLAEVCRVIHSENHIGKSRCLTRRIL